jgi:hypothetical protein
MGALALVGAVIRHCNTNTFPTTVLAKPFATAMESLAWLFSSQERRPVHGFSLILLVWTNGTLRIPLGRRLWRKGGPSKYELTLESLSYARNRLRCRRWRCADCAASAHNLTKSSGDAKDQLGLTGYHTR